MVSNVSPSFLIFALLLLSMHNHLNVYLFDILSARTKHGYSIYDGEFADESFHVKHTEPGLLGMCKRGTTANSNECQFYVTLGAPLSFLDGQTVVFGRVVEGFRVFKLIEQLDLVNEKPTHAVKIASCGEYHLKKPKLGKKK